MALIERGNIYWCNLNPVKGREQQGIRRPILIVQNYIGNKYSPTTIGIIFTSEFNEKDKNYPTNIFIPKDTINNLEYDSILETSQIRTLDKNIRITDNSIGHLTDIQMKKVDMALKYSLELLDKCPGCNYMLEGTELECPRCKLALLRKCSECSKLLDISWKFCPYCGKEV